MTSDELVALEGCHATYWLSEVDKMETFYTAQPPEHFSTSQLCSIATFSLRSAALTHLPGASGLRRIPGAH